MTREKAIRQTRRAHDQQWLYELRLGDPMYCTDFRARLRWRMTLHPYGHRYTLLPVDNVVRFDTGDVAVVF